MHSFEQFIAQLEARRDTVRQERTAAYARRQAALDSRKERRSRTFNEPEREVYTEATKAVRAADANLSAINDRIRHQKDELERAGKGNPVVESIRGNGNNRVATGHLPARAAQADARGGAAAVLIPH